MTQPHPDDNDVDDVGIPVPPKKKQRTRIIYYENTKREVRDSTKAKTTTTELEVKERNKIIPKSRPIIKHKYTQKELLLDALETENVNRKWLEHRKIVEDERIARDKPVKTQNNDHYVRSLSRRGTYDTITFTDVDSMPAILKYQIKPIVPKNVSRFFYINFILTIIYTDMCHYGTSCKIQRSIDRSSIS